jgi:transcriptional regulator with XRE-family HTH domain
MSTPAILVGPRIQKIRLRQNRTLDEIARKCGFTKSLLSKIERERTVPPIATLMKIADSLGVRLSDLLTQNGGDSTVFTPAAALADGQLTVTEKGYLFHLFAAGRAEKLMQPFVFVARKGHIKPGALSHRGEEFIHVLSGRMLFRVGAADYRLGPGDSLYFDSEEEHDLQAITDKVVYLAIFVEPPPSRPARAK